MNKAEILFLSNYELAYKCLRKLHLPAYGLNAKKHSIIKRHIMSENKDVIDKYKTLNYVPNHLIGHNSPIWIMWWQGEKAMPDVVKICYANVKRYAGNHPINLITHDTFCQFVSRKSTVETFLADKKINLTHLSDIIRCYLLYTYGGIWIDSTLLLTSPIDDIIKQTPFYTGRRVSVKDNYFVPQGKWTSYFCASVKDNPLFSFIYDMLVIHLQKEGKLMDYFMLDYFFTVAYEQFPFVKEMVDSVPPVQALLNEMMNRMNEAFNNSAYQYLCQQIPFHKLTYKATCIENTANGEQTYYGFFKKNINDKL